MIIIGIDPGFASLGWAILDVDPNSEPWGENLLAAGVISTKKESRKRKNLESDDLIRRIRCLRSGLMGLVCVPSFGRKRKLSRGSKLPRDKGEVLAVESCAYIATEQMSWGFQGVRAHRQLGMAWGVIVSVSEQTRKGLVGIAPMDLKLAITGDKNASKKAVEADLLERTGCERLEAILDSYAKNKREHITDAVGAALASLNTDVARFFGVRT